MRGGPYYQGGPRRDSAGMAKGAAALRDEGGLPAEASLIFTQLLLNLAGYVGRERAEKLIGAFLDAADVRRGRRVKVELFELLCEFCGEQLFRCMPAPSLRESGELPRLCTRALLAHWNAEPRCAAAVANHHGIRRSETGQTGSSISGPDQPTSTGETPEK